MGTLTYTDVSTQQTFSLQGTSNNQPNYPDMNGSMTVDVSTGTIISLDFDQYSSQNVVPPYQCFEDVQGNGGITVCNSVENPVDVGPFVDFSSGYFNYRLYGTISDPTIWSGPVIPSIMTFTLQGTSNNKPSYPDMNGSMIVDVLGGIIISLDFDQYSGQSLIPSEQCFLDSQGNGGINVCNSVDNPVGAPFANFTSGTFTYTLYGTVPDPTVWTGPITLNS